MTDELRRARLKHPEFDAALSAFETKAATPPHLTDHRQVAHLAISAIAGELRRKASRKSETTIFLTGTCRASYGPSSNYKSIAADTGKSYAVSIDCPLPTGVAWGSLHDGTRVRFTVTSEASEAVASISALLATEPKSAADRWEENILRAAEMHGRQRRIDALQDVVDSHDLIARNAHIR